MKIGNWCKKLSATLVAAGIFVPSVCSALNIPLGDASFEDYVVPASVGYAYAANPNGTYRPTSAWIDDQDSPSPPLYSQDNAISNWLYDANYAGTLRPAPRTGNQAMHGLSGTSKGAGHYSSQESSAVFEAGKTYTFSIYAQGDSDATGASSRVWLYIYDGSIAFSEGASLTFDRYGVDTGDFLNRAVGDSAADSQAKWRQISLSFDALAGGSYLGKPVGVGVWSAGDNALDDAALSVRNTIPEPSTLILVGIGGVTLLALRRKL